VISNIDEDNLKLLHASNKEFQMMPKGFDKYVWMKHFTFPR
jgi:hypothetical protein